MAGLSTSNPAGVRRTRILAAIIATDRRDSGSGPILSANQYGWN
jgi:hypothetical protein